MSDKNMNYVARDTCGCIVEAIADKPARRDTIAEMMREWILEGLTVERVPDDVIRAEFRTCPHQGVQLPLTESER